MALIALSTARPSDAQTASKDAMIEETIVTAQRVEEEVQDVPLSIAVLTGAELDARAIQRIADLIARIPNVQITGDPSLGATGGTFTVRGIPDVLVYVDGVAGFWPFGSIARQVIEVDRVEVLRGPQGTLFGKDATGGAIQYVTTPPADDFALRASATFGDYDRQDYTAAVDWPLSDTVKTKWTGARLSRDGFVDSVTIDRSFGDFDDDVLRGDLLWKPNAEVRLRFNIEDNEYRANGQPRILANVYEPQILFSRAQVYLAAGVPFSNLTHASGFSGGELGESQSRSAYWNDGWNLKERRAVLDLEWSISDNLTLKSISGDFDARTDVSLDHCACELNMWFQRVQVHAETRSQEVQLRGNHARVSWLTGVYYADGQDFQRGWFWQFKEFRDDPALLERLNETVPIVPPGNFDTGSIGNGTVAALFGQAKIRLGGKSWLTVGARRSEERGETAIPSFPYTVNDAVIGGDPTGPIDVYDADPISERFGHTAPRASFEHTWSDKVMTYVSYAEGFNSGGVNVPGVPGLPETIPYDPETVKTTELGLRSDWRNRRLRLNATVFSTDWEDIQVPVFLLDPSTGTFIPVGITVNAAAAKADGAEIDLIALPAEHWRIDLGLGVLDARYTDAGGALNISVGTPFANAPEKSYSLGVQNNSDLRSGAHLTARLDYGWVDDYATVTPANLQLTQPHYGLLSAHVSYEFPGRRYRLSLFGTNLTDVRYFDSAVADPGAGYATATLGRPREIGLTLHASFD